MAVRNLVLIGFMGSGKTSVGKELARRLDRPFLDTDEMVEQALGLSIAEIFARWGERRFREEEARAVAQAAAGAGLVIATGGGAVLDPANVAALREGGVLVYLETSTGEAMRRAGAGGSRPLLQSRTPEEVNRLWEERRPYYLAAADLLVPTDGLAVEEVSERLLKLLGGEAGRHEGA